MKRSILFMMAVSAIAVLSCTKEINNETAPEKVTMSFDATLGAPTKVELGASNGEGGYKVLWSKGDEIAVFTSDPAAETGSTQKNEFVTDIQSASAQATFSGEIETADVYYAVYPYESAVYWSEQYDNMTVELPAAQKANGIASGISIATAEGASLQFEHVTGYVKFTIPAEYTDIKEVRFSGNNSESLAGQYRVYRDNGTTPNKISNTKYSELTLTPSSESVFAPGTYYFTAFPTELSGLTITFIKSDDSKATKTSANAAVIKAGDILNLGKITGLDFEAAVKETWSLVTNVEDIVDGKYVILATKDKTAYGYLPSTTTTQNPAYLNQNILNPSVSVASVAIEDVMIWNVVSNNDGTITLTNEEGKYFYGTNDAQGLRVGDTEDKWEIAVHPTKNNAFYMKSVNGTRYVGVLNSDWRSYSTPTDANYDVTIEDTPYDGLKSQLYLFYCGTISQKTKLSSPANVVATVQNTNEIVVSWTAVTNAGSYDVTCGDETVNVTATTYTFTGLNYATDYTVYVTAKPADKTMYYSSDSAASDEVTTGQLVGVNTYSWVLAKGELGTNGAPLASVTKGTPTVTWNASYSWPENATQAFNWDSNNNRGVQIGTGTAPNNCNSFILTASDFGKVNSITIGANTASKGNATLSVTVGGTPLKCGDATSVALNTTTTPTTYTFTSATSLEGDIVITVTNNAVKALYLASININK